MQFCCGRNSNKLCGRLQDNSFNFSFDKFATRSIDHSYSRIQRRAIRFRNTIDTRRTVCSRNRFWNIKSKILDWLFGHTRFMAEQLFEPTSFMHISNRNLRRNNAKRILESFNNVQSTFGNFFWDSHAASDSDNFLRASRAFVRHNSNDSQWFDNSEMAFFDYRSYRIFFKTIRNSGGRI